MNRFGSNANAMGGSAGRANAMIGTVEAQMAEGCLHLYYVLVKCFSIRDFGRNYAITSVCIVGVA